MHPTGCYRRLLLVALAALAALVLATAAQAASVEGRVLHGDDGRPVPGVQVAFLVQQDGQLNEILRKPSDAEGRFVFSGPFLTAGLDFVLVAFYNDVPYPSTQLRMGDQRGVLLEVYEPTSDPATLHIATHSLFFSVRHNGVEGLQIVQLHNGGKRTYVGDATAEQRRVAEFRLPEGVFNLQAFSGNLTQAGPGRFFDDRPLPPGDSQIAFSYFLDTEALDGGYVHHAVYPTQALEVMVHPASLALGPPFEDLGEIEFQNGAYRRWRLEGVDAGQAVAVPLDLPRSLRWTLKWGALGLALVGLVAGAALGRGADEAAPVEDAAGLEAQRRELLRQIARLDDEHAGQTEDAAYRQRRQQLIGQALDLQRQLEAAHGD